jgi:hypothetical protein
MCSPSSTPSHKADHYTVLGISPEASDAEIKRSYRKSALELHLRGQHNFGTVDMLDFFVHHLSRYKGTTGAYNVAPKYERNWNHFLKRLDEMQQTHERTPFNNPTNERNGNVLAITPFHAGTDRHSIQNEKQLSLNVTVKALARIFPNIVITVCDQAKSNYIINESGLNEYIYDVLLVKKSGAADNMQASAGTLKYSNARTSTAWEILRL